MNPRLPAVVAIGLTLGGCALFAPPVPLPPREAPAAAAPAAWSAPLPPLPAQPAMAQPADALRGWWQQFDDPLLVELIDATQAVSPSIATAASRIEQARAARVAAGAALLPQLAANAAGAAGRADVGGPLYERGSASLQAAWEIDLFGAAAAGRDAAQARLEAGVAGWHDARVAVAAEVGTTYVALRGCEALVALTDADVRSRTETARITALAVKAGMVAPANGELARASAAQGRSLLAGQRAQCEQLLKALVALSGIDEPRLRERLAPGQGRLPQPATIAVQQVPGQALMQRPDLAAAASQVLAAADATAQSQALRYPRIGIAGSVGPAYLRIENSSLSGNLWTLGPLQVTLPLFDGGTLAANVVAARARYDEALALYLAAVRNALREVESALVTLDASAQRSEDMRVAVAGFEASLRATDARYRGGLGSLFELEEARRSALAANSALVDLQRERVTAWINLYRALGGGWTPLDLSAPGRSQALTPERAAPTGSVSAPSLAATTTN